MSRHTNVYDTFYLTQFDAMTEAISTWPDASLYVPKLRRLRNSLLEKGLNTFDPNPKHFNTLIHGDLFVNVFHVHFFTVEHYVLLSSALIEF